MTKYLVAIHHRDDFNAQLEESEETGRDIDALNAEMTAGGAIVFVGGLNSIGTAVSVRRKVDGELQVTDGPYLETKEHIGGFWVLDCASKADAVEWGRKAAIACRASVEIRPFN